MNNTLTIDIGNTNITAAVFRGRRLVKKCKIPTMDAASYGKKLNTLLKFAAKSKRQQASVIVSSVVPKALFKLKNAIRKMALAAPLVLGEDIAVPVKNLYKKKLQVGQDRLVDAFAAKCLYGAPAVIIDFGTAITFDIVSRRGEYLGGLILPGIEMGLLSLYERTALLPKVALRPAGDIIGKDTVSSMRGGILFGYGAMCDGLVARYRSILGPALKVIATGGNAALIKKYAKSIQVVDEDLTLKGLLSISVLAAKK